MKHKAVDTLPTNPNQYGADRLSKLKQLYQNLFVSTYHQLPSLTYMRYTRQCYFEGVSVRGQAP